MYGEFDLNGNSGRCPFLNEGGLCSIQIVCGHEALPFVCTNYPRNIHYTPAVREHTLSPSCEGVLEQLWNLPDGVTFTEDPLPKREWRNMNFSPEGNLSLWFPPIRELCIDLLQDRTMSLTNRMLCLGLIMQSLQQSDWERFNADDWTARMRDWTHAKETVEPLSSSPGNPVMYLGQNLKVLANLPAWDQTDTIYRALQANRSYSMTDQSAPGRVKQKTDFSVSHWQKACADFDAAFADREYFFENLMVAVALYLAFPDLKSPEALWNSYVSLCSLYSFYRFAAVLGCSDELSKERLFHMIVLSSRALLHNRERFAGFQTELFQHESTSLAHMAILLKG